MFNGKQLTGEEEGSESPAEITQLGAEFTHRFP